MPYYPTSQLFLEQAHLLIQARPTTTRITTKYKVPSRTDSPKAFAAPPTEDGKKIRRRQRNAKPKTTLTLKCYDPESGTCLKYQTDKGAEVGRLINALGACGQTMSGLPPPEQPAATDKATAGEITVDTAAEAKPSIANHQSTKVAEQGAKPEAKPQVSAQGGGSGSGGGKKKKKGKR